MVGNCLFSIRQTLALFRGQSWGDWWETGRSAYGPFRALRCRFELKVTVRLPPLLIQGQRVSNPHISRARADALPRGHRGGIASGPSGCWTPSHLSEPRKTREREVCPEIQNGLLEGHPLHDLVVEASVLGAEGRGFQPWPSHTNDMISSGFSCHYFRTYGIRMT